MNKLLCKNQNIDRNKHGKFGATEVKISSLVHERKLILRKRFLKICCNWNLLMQIEKSVIK